MKKMRIGIICPSEIAFRRFMPALQECDEFEYIGVAYAAAEEWDSENEISESLIKSEYKKALNFKENYGGKIFKSYNELIKSDEIDAVYLPLPPGLHFKWAKLALENGKHIFVEKPSTTSVSDSKILVNSAKEKNLALHENYMFVFHNQIKEINDMIADGDIGEVRLYRIAFGFPKREKTDFRYNKKLGGGALLDCGGYTLRLAYKLLGDTARIAYSNLNYTDEFEVDLYGSAAMVNDDGVTAQIAFGMDNNYKCEIEVWGSKGCIKADRIFTAPAGLEPNIFVKFGNEPEQQRKLSEDDTFKKSIKYFAECINNNDVRQESYNNIIKQSEFVESIKNSN